MNQKPAATADRHRRANGFRLVTVMVGLGLASLFIVDSSRAAFTATTGNAGSSLSAGTVVLTDDDAAATMFSLSNVNGGQTFTRCIKVTYSGSLTADVKLYGTVGGTGLAPGLATSIEVGTGTVDTGGPTFSCTGFSAPTVLQASTSTLADFGTNNTSYANGLGGFTGATNPTSRAYRVTITVSNDNAYQGKSATVGFTWEAQGQDAP